MCKIDNQTYNCLQQINCTRTIKKPMGAYDYLRDLRTQDIVHLSYGKGKTSTQISNEWSFRRHIRISLTMSNVCLFVLKSFSCWARLQEIVKTLVSCHMLNMKVIISSYNNQILHDKPEALASTNAKILV